MKLLNILISAFMVSVAAASRSSPQFQHRALEQHLVQRRSIIDPGLDSAKSQRRLLRKRGGRSKDCSGRKKKADSSEKTGSKSSSGSDNDESSSSTLRNESSTSSNEFSSTSHQTSSGKMSTNSSEKTDSSSKGASTAKSTSPNSTSTTNSGFAGLTFSGQCKHPNVSTNSPNGDISFLNCGISKSDKSSKWTPPNLQMKDITFITSEQAVQSKVFKPCSPYQADFKKAEKATGIPFVMLMSFAMQESTCDPNETGGNGERGMMQLTPDKCAGVNCYDAATNIMMGAKYFKSQVIQFNGNVLEAVGAYNGWSTDMTYSSATNLQWGCTAQNNLDYLNSFFNAWCMGKNGYSKEFLVYNNLVNCSN